MDWYSRKVLAWQVSNTLDDAFSVDALQRALACYGPPEIFHTDKVVSSPAASSPACSPITRSASSWTAKGRSMLRRMDNVFIERLWRSLKYECVYLQAFESPRDAEKQLDNWLIYYNHERPHSALADRTPDEAYRGVPPLAQAA